MTYLSTDFLIVYAFLLFTLIVGWWAGRGVKNIREYAIGKGSFGTAALSRGAGGHQPGRRNRYHWDHRLIYFFKFFALLPCTSPLDCS